MRLVAAFLPWGPGDPGCLVLTLLTCVYRKLTGMAFRVPTPNVSVVDLTCRLEKPVSLAWSSFGGLGLARLELE